MRDKVLSEKSILDIDDLNNKFGVRFVSLFVEHHWTEVIFTNKSTLLF